MKLNLNLSWYKQIYKSFKDKLSPKTNDEDQHCKNCETDFKGNFCPNCGQSIKEIDQPFNFLVYDFMGTMFAFDSRFFRSLYTLLFIPGRFTRDFILGKRQRYMSPFKFYVFVSFFFFLILGKVSNKGIEYLENYMESKSQSGQTMHKEVLTEAFTETINELNESSTDSIADISAKAEGNKIDLKFGADSVSVSLDGSEPLRSIKTSSISNGLIQYAKKNKWNESKMKMLNKALLMLNYPHVYIADFLKLLSWSLFLLMPVFAFLLKFFFIRHRIRYIRHLVFAVNIHSIMFMIYIFMMLLFIWLPAEYTAFSGYCFLLIPLYVYVGMKRFYQQSYIKTFVKFFILSGVYNLVLLLSLIWVGTYAFLNL